LACTPNGTNDEPTFSETFISYLLARNARIEDDLVGQLFNSSEKRLARVVLVMANFGKEGKPERIIAKINSIDTRRDCRDHAAAR
jgi:CRP/FNR family transcriptional regulator, cyclic AMP receptor protein